MKSIKIVLLLVCLFKAAIGQEITIGQSIPYAGSFLILNSKQPSTTLARFKGKPLLLNFWNTHCSVGLEYLAKLDSIRRSMHNELQVILITGESADIVNAVWANKKILHNIRLPVIVEDTMLRKLFPHRIEPHLVWISRDGIIQAITGYEEGTIKNLTAFVQNQKVQLPQKKEVADPDIFFSLTPLMVNEYEKNKNKLFTYSYLGAYRPGIFSGSTVARYMEADSTVRIHAQNISAYRLYELAYKQFQFFHQSRFVLEGNADSIIKAMANSYCYDLIIKDSSKEKAYNFMRQDLDRYFGLSGSFEKRKIKVLVLRRTSAIDKLKALQQGQPDKYITRDSIVWRNIKWRYFIETEFNEPSLLPYHVIDETGYSGKVNISIVSSLNDWKAVNESLKKFDLSLALEERWLDTIVLKDK